MKFLRPLFLSCLCFLFSPNAGAQNPDSNDPFEILGVSPDADEATIRKAYINAAKKYHPDKVLPELQANTMWMGMKPDQQKRILEKQQEIAKKYFQKIEKAYSKEIPEIKNTPENLARYKADVERRQNEINAAEARRRANAQNQARASQQGPRASNTPPNSGTRAQSPQQQALEQRLKEKYEASRTTYNAEGRGGSTADNLKAAIKDFDETAKGMDPRDASVVLDKFIRETFPTLRNSGSSTPQQFAELAEELEKLGRGNIFEEFASGGDFPSKANFQQGRTLFNNQKADSAKKNQTAKLYEGLMEKFNVSRTTRNSAGNFNSSPQNIANALKDLEPQLKANPEAARAAVEEFLTKSMAILRNSGSEDPRDFANLAEALDNVKQRYLFDKIVQDTPTFKSKGIYLAGAELFKLRKAAGIVEPSRSGFTQFLKTVETAFGGDITDLSDTIQTGKIEPRKKAFKLFFEETVPKIDFNLVNSKRGIEKFVRVAEAYGSLDSLGPVLERVKNTSTVDDWGRALMSVSDPETSWKLLDQTYGKGLAREKFLKFFEETLQQSPAGSAAMDIERLKRFGAADPALAGDDLFNNLADFGKRNPSFMEKCKVRFSKVGKR